MTVTRVPVLIVGAGAGGLATSALLAPHGVRSLLVEKRREIFIYPKARNLSFRSVDLLRGRGLGAPPTVFGVASNARPFGRLDATAECSCGVHAVEAPPPALR
ncbi:hypothetical protein MBOT_28270 [Mycobacterium botniense]|uniref:FAD-binding domain-containing protein n=1 Tax=Mycobacterium botniense TaxID=84962 RepID=A0A7I9Y068_9MYCO|nr:hypothetical protein MBOT_28270 [Mycobacterium botniense]